LLTALPAVRAAGFGAELRAPGPLRNAPGTLTGVNGRITPVDRFFIRDHFEEPDIPLASWKLKVERHVAQRLEISFSDLVLAPVERREVTVECAGNGPRGFAVSTSVWKGVPISFLLAAASPLEDAGELLLEGADEGRLLTGARRAPYTRIVPLARGLASEALVYELNRQLLPRANGFPARALLPGWYAMDSVKWLRKIVVLKRGSAQRHITRPAWIRFTYVCGRAKGRYSPLAACN
jgi:DMSO/TMAO reductase YedYZ molybdopterin-dependent catalytic subunit